MESTNAQHFLVGANGGRFHKSWAHGTNYRDSSIPLRSTPSPCFEKLFTGVKVRRKGIGRKKSLGNRPQVVYRVYLPYSDVKQGNLMSHEVFELKNLFLVFGIIDQVLVSEESTLVVHRPAHHSSVYKQNIC